MHVHCTCTFDDHYHVYQLQLLDLTSKLEDLQEDQKDNEEYRQKLKKENTSLMTRYLVNIADLIIHCM